MSSGDGGGDGRLRTYLGILTVDGEGELVVQDGSGQGRAERLTHERHSMVTWLERQANLTHTHVHPLRHLVKEEERHR